MQPQPQPQPQTTGSMGVAPPTNITTAQIQKYLDENKQLILAILDNQNLGKVAECAQYQAQLQKNLLYLAAIADAQPQSPPTTRPQMIPQGGGGPQLMQQPPMFPPKTLLQHQPQMMMPFLGSMGMRPLSVPNGGGPGMAEPVRASTQGSLDAVSEHGSGNAEASTNTKRLDDTKTP